MATASGGLLGRLFSRMCRNVAQGDDASAAEVTKAGGYGFMSSSYISESKLHEEINIARQNLNCFHPAKLKCGIGHLCWILEKGAKEDAHRLLDLSVENFDAIWLSFGADLQQWAAYIRSRPGGQSIKLFVLVSTVAEALKAVEMTANVLVAQGIESGGHGLSSSLPLFSFLPLLLEELPHGEQHAPYVVAAGGLVTVSQVMACLVLGADGAALGTRFLATPESLYSQSQKEALVKAESNSTVRTTIFDTMRGTLGWPAGIDGRALINKTYLESISGRSEEEIKQEFAKATANHDTSRSLVWAGSSVGLIKSILPAAQITRDVGQAVQDQMQAMRSS